MLLRVESVECIGRFRKLSHKAQQFERLTLIFARNGYGKSTISSILRSIHENDVSLVEARKSLGAKSVPGARFMWAGGASIALKNGKWTSCPGPIHVFDGDYVRRNVHVADSVTRENKRSLISVVVGKEGVDLAEEIASLDAEHREITKELGNLEKGLKLLLPAVEDIAAFVSHVCPDDIDDRIAAARRTVKHAENSHALKSRRKIPDLPDCDLESWRQLLLVTIADVSEVSMKRVRDHMELHRFSREDWLREGVKHISDTCPFCNQDIRSSDIVTYLAGYFSTAYEELIDQIDVAIQGSVRLNDESKGLLATLMAQEEDLAFWSTLCDLGEVPHLSKASADAIVSTAQELERALREKRAMPFSIASVTWGKDCTAAIEELTHYSRELLRCVAAIELARSQPAEVTLEVAQAKLNKLIALKSRESRDVAPAVQAWKASSSRRAEIEASKKITQERLRLYVSKTVGDRQQEINDLLELFGANFQICEAKASFVGREASAEYCLSVGSEVVPAGERKPGVPSFATVLSAGDKYTLALAFFITQVRRDQAIGSGVVVFDDPFNSQDMHRQSETARQIRSIAGDACQVIVLSHDPRFLNLIEKNARPDGISSFQILCDERGIGEIKHWSSEEELKEKYIREAERIREYASSGCLPRDVSTDTLVKDIRPFLESYLRARFPGRFSPLVMLDEMTNIIEHAGQDDPLFNSVQSLRALNEYTRDFMHGGSNSPHPPELRAHCKRVMKLVGSY